MEGPPRDLIHVEIIVFFYKKKLFFDRQRKHVLSTKKKGYILCIEEYTQNMTVPTLNV